jgi:hypothetical protein
MTVFIVTILVLLVIALTWAYDYACRGRDEAESMVTTLELELAVANNIIASDQELLLKQKLGAETIAVLPSDEVAKGMHIPHGWDEPCSPTRADRCEWCPPKVDIGQPTLPFNVIDHVFEDAFGGKQTAYWGD